MSSYHTELRPTDIIYRDNTQVPVLPYTVTQEDFNNWAKSLGFISGSFTGTLLCDSYVSGHTCFWLKNNGIITLIVPEGITAVKFKSTGGYAGNYALYYYSNNNIVQIFDSPTEHGDGGYLIGIEEVNLFQNISLLYNYSMSPYMPWLQNSNLDEQAYNEINPGAMKNFEGTGPTEEYKWKLFKYSVPCFSIKDKALRLYSWTENNNQSNDRFIFNKELTYAPGNLNLLRDPDIFNSYPSNYQIVFSKEQPIPGHSGYYYDHYEIENNILSIYSSSLNGRRLKQEYDLKDYKLIKYIRSAGKSDSCEIGRGTINADFTNRIFLQPTESGTNIGMIVPESIYQNRVDIYTHSLNKISYKKYQNNSWKTLDDPTEEYLCSLLINRTDVTTNTTNAVEVSGRYLEKTLPSNPYFNYAIGVGNWQFGNKSLIYWHHTSTIEKFFNDVYSTTFSTNFGSGPLNFIIEDKGIMKLKIDQYQDISIYEPGRIGGLLGSLNLAEINQIKVFLQTIHNTELRQLTTNWTALVSSVQSYVSSYARYERGIIYLASYTSGYTPPENLTWAINIENWLRMFVVAPSGAWEGLVLWHYSAINKLSEEYV